MKQLWIGVVEVLLEPTALNGDTRAFTNVVTWANGTSEYADSVTTVFAGYGWTVLGIENERPIDCETNFSEEIAEIIESAKTNPNACIFATFYSYPSPPN
jgi:hypothetical protein